MSIFDKLFRGEHRHRRDLRAALDPCMRDLLGVWKELGPRPLDRCGPEEARVQPMLSDAVRRMMFERTGAPPPSQGVVTRDFSFPGPAGEAVPARLYGLEQRDDERTGPSPVLIYWHGGGWVVGDLDRYDEGPRAMARLAGCIVVSCRYRQAPEHPFPGAHEDALAAYRWVLASAELFGGDPARVAVAGEGAGGNLACNVSLTARDLELKPPVHQVLIHPVAGTDTHTPSYREHADAEPVGKAVMEWFFAQFLGEPGDSEDDRLNLADTADLRFLPASTVLCAEIDPLRSEGERLAEALERAGVRVTHKTFAGVTHDFFGAAAVLPAAASAQQLVADDLKRAFGSAVLPV
jgi:acetyl esterase/lipase